MEAKKPKASIQSHDPTDVYLKHIGQMQLLSRAEELSLFKKIARGNRKAKKTLIERNLRLVVHIAKKYRKQGIEFMDLIEEGNLGLMHAMSKFDHKKGFRFATYATWWIKQTIEHSLLTQKFKVHIPINLVKKCKKIKQQHTINFLTKDRKTKKDESSAKPNKIALTFREKLAITAQHAYSLDQKIAASDADSEKTLHDIVPNNDLSTLDELCEQETKRKIVSWISALESLDRNVLTLRYGLNKSGIACTLSQIANHLKLSPETIRKILRKNIYKLRCLIKDRNA
jgi:RNA polymerase sigma factor (sigma-70 family)